MSSVNTQFQQKGITVPQRPLPIGAAKTLTQPEAHQRMYAFDQLAGSIATLPQAVGSGCEIEFVATVMPTSNSHIIKVGNVTDIIQGVMTGVSDTAGTGIAWKTGATDDTITWNRTTSGLGAIGDFVKLKDIKAGVWAIIGSQYSANGAEITPFSATV